MSENEEEINGEESSKKTENSQESLKSKKSRLDSARKILKKAAGKHSLLAAIGPILFWIFVGILILIIIIGLAMFFITMPGMIMEQLKALGKKIGDAFARFFGEDQTTNVENEQIYDTLDYLEQMGYDLKGFGFLTDYVSDTDQIDEDAPDDNGINLDKEIGVLRDDDDKIITAKSDFIYSYIVSDNYLYTIKNQNHVAGDGTGGFWNGLLGLGQNILSFLTGGQLSQYWSRGFIEIYVDDGVVGNSGTFYKDHPILTGDKITLNTDSKTLEIKRGRGNNSITYNLDGWVGRYGMPVDFLMSIQLATMMSDLAYDMATTFETQLTLLLHPVGGGEKDENTAVGYYKSGDKYYSYDDFYEAAKSGITGFLNSWRVSKKEAMNIMREFNIKSPSNCLGTDGVGVDEIDSGNYNVGLKENDTDKQNEAVKNYNTVMEILKGYGYSGDSGLPLTASSFNEYLGFMENVERNESSGLITYVYNDDSKVGTFSISWIPSDTSEYSSYTAEITLRYDNYIQNISGSYATGGPSTVSIHSTSINYSITGEWSEERINEYLEENEISTVEESRCSNVENKEECCSSCRSYIQTIYDYLKKVDVSNLDIYQPYISKVKNHWYRDVYFVSDKSKQFVTYDYEYEAMMKERWTLYETYDYTDTERAGEYKLYALNSKGGYARNTDDIEHYNENSSKFEKSGNYYLFKGTQKEALNLDINVSKKAKTIKISDEAEDLNWKETAGGKLSAYEISDETIEDFQEAYPDITEDEKDYEIKKNVYVNVITTGNVSQTGEGQRIETNNEIKKMFLKNKYFRYDGSAKTAEIITALRENIYGDDDERYGAIDESKIKDKNGKAIEYELDFSDKKYTSEAKSGKYKLADYTASVSLNQDSLNAFSMLENTHTLDADYIYRDFKELIVELGYFTKEELTDETPRLLQWLIPEIGSGGFPNRAIDKREQEYGTMIHSKGDIDANVKNTLAAAIAMAADEDSTEELEAGKKTETSGTNGISLKEQEFDKTVKGLNLKSQQEFTSLGSATKTSSSELLSIDEWWESQQEMFDVFKAESWTYAQDHSCATFDDARSSKHTTDCSLMASWALQRVGALKDGHTFSSHMGHSGTLDESNACAQDLLDAGAEVIVPSAGTKFSNAANSGELAAGDVLFYDGHVSIYCGEEYEKGGVTFCWDTGSTTGIQCGGPRDTSYEDRDIKLILRLPLGTAKSSGDSYKGYEGNEAVVSPVTGILLEYGTYTDEDIDSVTGEKYRTNVDLKYGPTNTPMFDEQGNPISVKDQSKNPEEQEGGEIVADKVGYAKILVLDAENYQKLESNTANNWENDSLVKIGEAKKSNDSEAALETQKSSSRYLEKLTIDEQMDEEHENWSNLDKTVYGYKEFAESYEKYGIAGNIVYIDGFKCELPDTQTSGEGEESDSDTSDTNTGEQIPNGEKLTIDSFKKITQDDLTGTEPIDSEDVIESKYNQDDEYKMASKKATDKINAESLVKSEANSTIYLEGEDLIFIKEGTVIGRTITDKELVEKIRNNQPHNYEYYRSTSNNTTTDESSTGGESNESGNTKKDKNQDKVMGNYIRIIMRDLDDTVVENIEDHMKLDEDGDSFAAVDQEYKAWEGDLEALAEVIFHEAGYSYLAALSNKFASDQQEADFEMYCMGYSVVNKLLEQNSQWYGHLYDASRTDMSPLIQVVTNAKARWYGYDTSHVTNKMKCYTEKELEYAEFCLTYDCTSVKKPYDTPLGGGAVGDGYTKTTQGTVIPRALCQQGGYGDGASGQSNIILVSYWDHNNNNQFDKGDELWGVDRAMEGLLAQDNVTQD